MYSINKIKTKKKISEKGVFCGFPMASSKKIFNINGCSIKDIMVMDKNLANPLASKKVMKQYNKLITYLTQLLIDTDDDDGDTYREVLNQIEKFRLIIKNKYRDFLMRKELEKMSKQLKILQKEAQNRFYELQNSMLVDENVNNRRR